jgi:hypothetical protein
MPPLTAAAPRLKNSVRIDHRPAARLPDKGDSVFTHNSSLRQTILMHFVRILSDLCLRSQHIASRFPVAIEKVMEFCMKKMVLCVPHHNY